MGRQKITLLELGEQLRAGKSAQEIAKEFGMSARGVRKRCQELDIEISKSATLHQAGVILSQQIDAQAQLLKINTSANRLLDRLERQLDADQASVIAKLETQVLELKPYLGLSQKLADDFLVVLKESLVPLNQTTTDQVFKALAEIRKQLELLAKVAADWLEAKRLAVVHQVIFEEIGHESPECRKRIIKRLGELQSSGLLFPIDG